MNFITLRQIAEDNNIQVESCSCGHHLFLGHNSGITVEHDYDWYRVRVEVLYRGICLYFNNYGEYEQILAGLGNNPLEFMITWQKEHPYKNA